jgi:CheY-like chemotaxis protein
VRVLVVDDEPGIRENLAEILEAEGYEVRSAVNGLDALAVLRDWVPDAILLDLMMPRMGGKAFREAQLARPEIADVPTLVFTAYRDQADPALGNVDLLTKDIGAEAILAMLHERISERPKKRPATARMLGNAAIVIGGLATLAKVIWDLLKGRKYR